MRGAPNESRLRHGSSGTPRGSAPGSLGVCPLIVFDGRPRGARTRDYGPSSGHAARAARDCDVQGLGERPGDHARGWCFPLFRSAGDAGRSHRRLHTAFMVVVGSLFSATAIGIFSWNSGEVNAATRTAPYVGPFANGHALRQHHPHESMPRWLAGEVPSPLKRCRMEIKTTDSIHPTKPVWRSGWWRSERVLGSGGLESRMVRQSPRSQKHHRKVSRDSRCFAGTQQPSLRQVRRADGRFGSAGKSFMRTQP
jgi:hypothetical protein